MSLRRVSAALDAGPMRLYGYIATKNDLLDLMVDALFAQIRPAGDRWQDALRSLAEVTRHVVQQHEWLADLIGGRPHLGPHALSRGKPSSPHSPTSTSISRVPIVAAVDAYVIGAARREVPERRAERSTGMSTAQWQAAFGPHLERTFATGRYPALARVVSDGEQMDADETFRAGLNFLLDGIQARITG